MKKVHTGTDSTVERLKGVFKLAAANISRFFTLKLMDTASSWAYKSLGESLIKSILWRVIQSNHYLRVFYLCIKWHD